VAAARARRRGVLRLLDAVSIYYQTSFVLAAVGLLVVAAELEPQMRGTFIDVIAGATLLGGLGILATWWAPLHRGPGRVLRRWIPPKIFSLLGKLSRTLIVYRAHPVALALNFLMAVGENLLTMLIFYVIGRALGIQL
jgi:hypothetical protein